MSELKELIDMNGIKDKIKSLLLTSHAFAGQTEGKMRQDNIDIKIFFLSDELS